MKQLITFFLFAALTTVGFGQQGLTIGANFMGMNSNLVNQNTWGNGREYDYKFTFSTSFGIDVGYNLSDQFGIRTGYWFTDFGQNYEDAYIGSDWTRDLKLKYNIIPVMALFNGTKSTVNFVAGAGVLFASLNEAQQEWLRDGNQYNETIQNPVTGDNFNLGATDVTDRFAKSDILINVEMGARIIFSEKLYLDATLNFGYGLKDVNDADWQIENGSGVYDPTHNAYGGLKVGLNYVLLGS